MSEIESVTHYWEEFFRTHPDPADFRSLVAEDPILTKIFNFSSVPVIWMDIRNYPFEAKKAERKTISKEDREHFEEKHFHADSTQVEWFDYLSNLFDVVLSTLLVKEILDIQNAKQGRVKQDEEIIKFVESIFNKFISRDEIILFKEINGIQKSIRRYGRYYPIRWINFIITRDRNRGMIERVYQEHFILPPSEEIIEQPLRDLDRYSVINIGKYGKEIDDICFGSPDSIKNIVELYYKGKRFGGPFPVPISERYRPLRKKKVRNSIQKYGTKLGTKEELLTTFDEKLFKRALRYDPSSPVDPAGYFEAEFKYFENEIFKVLSTTALHVPCDNHCKREKELMNKLPCEFENSLGYCNDPKHHRVLKSIIDSGRRLSDPITDKRGQKSEEGLKLEDIVSKEQSDLQELTKEDVARKEEFLARIYNDFPKLKDIVAKEEQGIALSVNERQIKSRSLMEIKKSKKKYQRD